jgi:hypothetical protein
MAALLPIYQSSLKELTLLQTKWSALLNQLLINPSLQSSILTDVSLVIGPNVINHLLGRKLIGWRIIGINAAATIYDGQDTNLIPKLTLVLVSNAVCKVNLEVF